jgi:hypothetical protein
LPVFVIWQATLPTSQGPWRKELYSQFLRPEPVTCHFLEIVQSPVQVASDPGMTGRFAETKRPESLYRVFGLEVATENAVGTAARANHGSRKLLFH